MLFKYIATLYAKHLFFILLALVSFFVFFDYILTVKKLPDATNLRLLYASFKAMEALEVLWQLSVIFAFITAWISLVKSNALVSFYSLGYSKKALMLPFITVFGAIYLLMAGLQLTTFSLSKDKASQIRSYGAVGSVTTDIFFKYDDNYVYMKKLSPLQQTAQNIRIFEFDKDSKLRVIEAKEAYFDDDYWMMPQVKITQQIDAKVTVSHHENYASLHRFKPRVLESVYESGSGFTLKDALDAVTLLTSQGVKTDKIRAIIYNKVITPLFALVLILIYFHKLPKHARFSNLTLATTVFTLVGLISWGVLFAIYKITVTGVVNPEIGMIAPIVVMALYLLILVKKSKL
ncbi:MAG: LptF/LptG family permease [Campylobacterota bacterium]